MSDVVNSIYTTSLSWVFHKEPFFQAGGLIQLEAELTGYAETCDQVVSNLKPHSYLEKQVILSDREELYTQLKDLS